MVSSEARAVLKRIEFETPAYLGYPELVAYLVTQTGEHWNDDRVREEFLLPILDKALNGFTVAQAMLVTCRALKVEPLDVSTYKVIHTQSGPKRDIYGRRRDR